MPIGSYWAEASWPETAWAMESWGAETVPPPLPPPTMSPGGGRVFTVVHAYPIPPQRQKARGGAFADVTIVAFGAGLARYTAGGAARLKEPRAVGQGMKRAVVTAAFAAPVVAAVGVGVVDEPEL